MYFSSSNYSGALISIFTGLSVGISLMKKFGIWPELVLKVGERSFLKEGERSLLKVGERDRGVRDPSEIFFINDILCLKFFFFPGFYRPHSSTSLDISLKLD